MNTIKWSPAFGVGLRGLFRRPEEIVEGTRWLFTLLAVVSPVLSLLAVLSTARGGVLLLAFAATLTLAASWIYGYLSKRVPLGMPNESALSGFGGVGHDRSGLDRRGVSL